MNCSRNGARVRSTAVGGASVGRVGLETEASLTTRLTGARDVALGLLLRDPTAAVVARALREYPIDGLGTGIR